MRNCKNCSYASGGSCDPCSDVCDSCRHDSDTGWFGFTDYSYRDDETGTNGKLFDSDSEYEEYCESGYDDDNWF